MRNLALSALLALAAAVPASQLAAQDEAGYLVGVVSESGDQVTWLEPGPDGLTVARRVEVGIMPGSVDGPHNLAVAPDGSAYYVTIAHGTPFGSLWKLDAATDTLLGRAPVELFPTTIGLTPDGALAFVANSDFHGDRPRTNVVSVVHTSTMARITDLPACDMPHGVRANHAGSRVYVSCMHGDELLELDPGTFSILRRVPVGAGGDSAGHAHDCSPTFVSVSPDDSRLYVACNHANTLQVRDAATLALTATVPVGAGAYNVEPSPDGRWVIVTNKKDRSISVVDAATLEERARIPVSKPVVHGVAYSPDSRYAYISAESVGADPGAVDQVDLRSMQVVSTIAVPGQPTGIAILRR